jgi:hypothetical protein
MFLWREIKGAGAAPATQFHIPRLIRAIGHFAQGQVRDGQQEVAQPCILCRSFLGQPGDVGLGLGHQRAQPLKLRIIAARLCGAHILAGAVLFRLRGFRRQDFAAPRLVQRQDLRRQPRQSPACQGGVESGGVFADGADVVHGRPLVS